MSLSPLVRAALTAAVVASIAVTAQAVEPINPIVTDAAFHVAHDADPDATADADARIAGHLAMVADDLAARARGAVGTARARLSWVADTLRAYARAGRFPQNELCTGATPIFIDDYGNRCAVAHLLAADGQAALADAIDARHHFDLVADIDSPALVAWADEMGLSLEDLARIQPSYPCGTIRSGHHTWDGPVSEQVYTCAAEPARLQGAMKAGMRTGAWTLTDPVAGAIGVGTFEDGTGDWLTWHPDGTLAVSGRFVHDQAEGRWTYRRADGSLAAEGAFENGCPDGGWAFYAPDGDTLATLRFRKGKAHGNWRMSYADGTVAAIGRFVQDAPSGPWRMFHRNGQVHKELAFTSTGRAVGWGRAWAANGQLVAEGRFGRRGPPHDEIDEPYDPPGYRTGVWRTWYDDGALRSRARYRRDVRLGRLAVFGAERGDAMPDTDDVGFVELDTLIVGESRYSWYAEFTETEYGVPWSAPRPGSAADLVMGELCPADSAEVADSIADKPLDL